MKIKTEYEKHTKLNDDNRWLNRTGRISSLMRMHAPREVIAREAVLLILAFTGSYRGALRFTLKMALNSFWIGRIALRIYCWRAIRMFTKTEEDYWRAKGLSDDDLGGSYGH
jgi:hypothetical protein